ncbi:MAG TPA: restriction endonuclease [Herpetosiphonaceae bacterium]
MKLDALNDALWEVLPALWPLWLLLLAGLAFQLGRLLARRRRLMRSGIAEIDRMSGTQFETYLAYLFRQFGYAVEQTGKRGDFGADLVLSKDGTRTAVQAKRYGKNVGVKAVQEAVASKGVYGCQTAMVVTNSFYTKQARALAEANRVTLWDRDRLIDVILRLRAAGAPADGQPAGGERR